MRARDRIIIALGVLVIGVCTLVTAARIIAWSHSPAVQLPADYTPGPLVPVSTASPTATTPASSVSSTARPRPTHTITVWTTVTTSP